MAEKLSVEQIEVPRGMLDAGVMAVIGTASHMPVYERAYLILAAALLWLAENPIVPSEDWARETFYSIESPRTGDLARPWLCAEWQKRMFLRRVPELPMEVLTAIGECDASQPWTNELHKLAAKVYALGQKAKP